MIPGNANPLLLASAAADAAAAGPIKSLRFNSGDTATLSFTPSSAGNRKKWTWAGWVKRSELGRIQNIFRVVGALSDTTVFQIRFMSDDTIGVVHYSYFTLISDAVFRDVGAWLHLVVSLDVDQTSNSDKLRFYINGSELTSWSTDNRSGLSTNAQGVNQASVAHTIGGPGTSEYFSGYLADIYFIDGSQLDPTSFGAYADNGVWQAAAYSGTFGTNGFHLNFADGSDLGADNSGNDNDFTSNNLLGTVDPADVSVASATGALPIYNTTDTYGATQGTGTRTDSDASSLVLAIPFLTNQNDVHATVKGSGSNKTVSGSGASASSTKDKFYGGSFRFDGSTATPMNVADSDDFTFDGDFTVEAWVWPDATDTFQIVASKWDVGGQEFILAVESDGKAEFHWAPYSDGGPAIESAAGVVNAKAWNHLAAVRSSGTITLYVNGTSVGTRSNSTAATNRSTLLTIGYLQYLGGNKLAGYLQDLRIYKGAAKYTSNFNPPSDPADKLPGEGLDLLFDVPTNGTQSDTGAGGEVSGNYCTWNPIAGYDPSPTFSNGNLEFTASGDWHIARGTIGVKTGKYYAEFTTVGATMLGIETEVADAGRPYYNNSVGCIALRSNGKVFIDNVEQTQLGGWSDGDVIGMALNLDGSSFVVTKNNSAYTTISIPSNSYWNDKNVFYSATALSSNDSVTANWGQRAYSYSAPSNHKALCTTNLPTPTIADGSEYFDVLTWEGANGGTTRSFTGLSFSPDFVWSKIRSDSFNHQIYDSVRGAGNDKALSSNNNGTEPQGAPETYGYLSSFDSAGFTFTKGTSTGDPAGNAYFDQVIGAAETYVAWNWDAGANSSKTYTVKVVSDSGNKYRFDDFGTSAVTLDLEEGSTYVFDQSDSSNSGHPLRFSTTSDGTHNSGSEYTTGVTTTGTPGSAGAKTTIVVAASAPTLYYYCTNHSGMGGQANTNSTAGSSNFDGSVQATVKANQSAGFSCVSYTATGSNLTVGHGLNATPALIIHKTRNVARDWVIYHESLGLDYILKLNLTDGQLGPFTTIFTSVSSSTFGTGTNGGINTNNETKINYCFAPVAGYSAFGSYTGNGSSDGPFVYTGFRPRWVLIKATSISGQSWYILDAARDRHNLTANKLEANSGGAENASPNTATTNSLDLLSNGFKLRTSNDGTNQNNATYVYAAFSENAFSLNGGLAR